MTPQKNFNNQQNHQKNFSFIMDIACANTHQNVI